MPPLVCAVLNLHPSQLEQEEQAAYLLHPPWGVRESLHARRARFVGAARITATLDALNNAVVPPQLLLEKTFGGRALKAAGHTLEAAVSGRLPRIWDVAYVMYYGSQAYQP